MIGSLWNHKVKLVVLIVSLAFNAGVGVTAGVRSYQERCERGERPRHGGRHDLLSSLNLRPEQDERFGEARKAMFEDVREKRRTLREAHAALTELLLADEPDRQAVADQITVIAAIKESEQRRMIDHLLDIKADLDLDQVEAFDEILARRMERWQRPRGGRGGPRGHHRGDFEKGPRHPPEVDGERDGQ